MPNEGQDKGWTGDPNVVRSSMYICMYVCTSYYVLSSCRSFAGRQAAQPVWLDEVKVAVPSVLSRFPLVMANPEARRAGRSSRGRCASDPHSSVVEQQEQLASF